MRVAGRLVSRRDELRPVVEAVQPCDYVLRIEQREVVYALFGVGKIEKLVANEVANLLDIERAVEDVVEPRRRIGVSRVIDGDEIFSDTMVLIEFRSLRGLNVVYEPGPTFE